MIIPSAPIAREIRPARRHPAFARARNGAGSRFFGEALVDQTLVDMRRLLVEVTEHLKSVAKPDKTAAVAKLERIVALASTLAFTIRAARR